MAWNDRDREEIMHKEITKEDGVDAAASPATRAAADVDLTRSLREAKVCDDPLGCHTAEGLMGRHRLAAVVSHLEQEILSLQEELKEVEGRMRPSSSVCEEVAASVVRVPDPLVPSLGGPVDAAWDRWFKRVHGGKGESSRSGGGAGRRWWMQGRRFLPSSSVERRVEALAD